MMLIPIMCLSNSSGILFTMNKPSKLLLNKQKKNWVITSTLVWMISWEFVYDTTYINFQLTDYLCCRCHLL